MKKMAEDKPQAARDDPGDISGTALTPLPGESYFDGPYLVFTEAYHLRRGYCCQSGCRHCPYGFRSQPK